MNRADKNMFMSDAEKPIIYTDRYRIAALGRCRRAHIGWTSDYGGLDTESKVGDEVWVYPERPPHLGYLCIIEAIDVKATRRRGTLIKATVRVDVCPTE